MLVCHRDTDTKSSWDVSLAPPFSRTLLGLHNEDPKVLWGVGSGGPSERRAGINAGQSCESRADTYSGTVNLKPQSVVVLET